MEFTCTVVNDVTRESTSYTASNDTTLKALPINQFQDYYVICNGKLQAPNTPVEDGRIYHLVPRLVGGKGGFGSMLRAIGAQIEKTTNREACRDLSGRRMRDVNNEKKLKDWVAKAADREREKEERKRERMERRKAVPRHNFNDPTYTEQKTKVLDNLDDALRTGLQKSTNGSSTSATATKRKATTTTTSPGKKSRTEWLGVDIEDFSDSDEEDDSPGSSDEPSTSDNSQTVGDGEAQPSCSTDSGALPSQELRDITEGGCSNSSSDSDSPSSSEFKEPSESNVQNGHVSSTDDIKGDKESCTNCSQQRENELGDKNDESPVSNENSPSKKSGLLASLAKTPPKETKDSTADGKADQTSEVDLETYSSAEDLQSLGMDTLKAALMARGLKCGGTLEERAARLFSVKGLSSDEIDPALKSKGGKVKKSKGK